VTAAQPRRHRNPVHSPCRDCRTETLPDEPGAGAEFYMVDSRLWAGAGMEPNGGCLCIGCLERRLGRRLLPGDFTDADINSLDPLWRRDRRAWAYRTQRLMDRLTGQLALWEDEP
jgi:hypothetical protein